mgnify:CR=1 FL=1
MSIFNKLRQLTGDLPIKRKHLGQYSHKVNFNSPHFLSKDATYGNLERLNTDIYLDAYKTNSFKISIENRIKKQEFHLIGMPKMNEGYEVFNVMNDKNVAFSIGIKKEDAFIKMDDVMLGTRYMNR